MIMVLCFGDKNTADKILATDDVAEIKALGRLVANYNESYWNGVGDCLQSFFKMRTLINSLKQQKIMS